MVEGEACIQYHHNQARAEIVHFTIVLRPAKEKQHLFLYRNPNLTFSLKSEPES